VEAANDLYLHLPAGSVDPLTTPEGLYAITGVNSLTLDPSVATGESTLNNAILAQIGTSHVDVFGYSQSSTLSSELLGAGATYSNGDVPVTPID
jgi:hypothetical protein